MEGDAGAPVTLDEVMAIEACVDTVWNDLSATAQAEIDKQGVAYTDQEGDLVTSIVGGKDCVFTYYDDIDDFSTKQPIHSCCLCALEKAYRNGRSSFCKPISCALYPIRVKDVHRRNRSFELPPVERVQGCREERGRSSTSPSIVS